MNRIDRARLAFAEAEDPKANRSAALLRGILHVLLWQAGSEDDADDVGSSELDEHS